MTQPSFDPQPHLNHLKDFQARTVEYVFRRLYDETPAARRFLLAVEAGLGKSMVAKGIIAKAIQRLREAGVARIDVVYICSNAAIAAQNLSRLNILPRDARTRRAPQTSFATRLTLLPLHVGALGQNPVNFISFTPGTTFSLKSREGVMRERALLYAILLGLRGLSRKGLGRMLQGSRCSLESWTHARGLITSGVLKPDPYLVQAMRDSVSQDPKLFSDLKACALFWARRSDGRWAGSARRVEERLEMISRLRQRLSEVCLQALQPNLIILDEFQRFKDLLSEDDTASLAKQFFNHPGERGHAPRILLLSATPYKMYTVAGEVADDHYEDLLQTLRFLHHQQTEPVEAIRGALRRYRGALIQATHEVDDGGARAEARLLAARDEVQALLLQVMVRAERTASAAHRDAMIREVQITAPVQTPDLLQACAVDRVARAIGARDVIGYWKSAPYLLDFMKGYELTRRLDAHVRGKEGATPPPEALYEAARHAHEHALDYEALDAYQDIEPANPRLRVLLDQLDGDGLWRLLWLPSSLSYLEPAHAYAQARFASKALVFSAWNVVPDAIAALSSYRAERAMVGADRAPKSYETLSKAHRGLLRFSVSGERYAGMGALLLLYPSPTLAELGDPLRLARRTGGPIPLGLAIETVVESLRGRLKAIGLSSASNQPHSDPRWYWLAVSVLDAHRHPSALRWARRDDDRGFASIAKLAAKQGDDATGFEQVIERFVEHARERESLGQPPADLYKTLARIALGAPGICALRALQRQIPEAPLDDHDLLLGAARVGEGFRTLFNLPETMGLLGAFERGRDTDDEKDLNYWRRCLKHSLGGDLQAVLDEQAHVLRESLGLAGVDRTRGEIVDGISKEMAAALSVRTASLFAEGIYAARGEDGRGWLTRSREGHDDDPESPQRFAFRTRFGLRLGNIKDEEKGVQRLDIVRKAFNSPFRPFLLASTSVGQEGLDFHTWCHVLYHWNLPSNPVDMEQREGRVHRYKGLAVRRNLARSYQASLLSNAWDGVGDPWAWMFAQAREARIARDPGSSDLVPYWLFDEVPSGVPSIIERRVPLIPMSSEATRYQDLKRSLALYRLAFGQPRQDDLVHWLRSALGDQAEVRIDEWRIDLSAPLARE